MNKDRLIGAMTAIACVIAAELIMPLLGLEASLAGMLAMLGYYAVYFGILTHKEKQAQLEAEQYQRLLHEDYLIGLRSYELSKRKRKNEQLDTLNMQISNEINRINSEIYGED